MVASTRIRRRKTVTISTHHGHQILNHKYATAWFLKPPHDAHQFTVTRKEKHVYLHRNPLDHVHR